MSDTVRVYVNGKPVDVAADATALGAVVAFDPVQAAEIESGAKALTDSRGLPADADAPLHNGAIFRIVRARTTADDDLSAL